MDDIDLRVRQMIVDRLYLSVDPTSLNDSDNLMAKFNLDREMLEGIVYGLNVTFGITFTDEPPDYGRLNSVRGITSFVRQRANQLKEQRNTLFQRRDQLVAQITKAFLNVALGTGVSLHQTDVLDSYGTADDMKRARSKDNEHTWQGVNSTNIQKFDVTLCFLDPQGVRFYLPAYMVWILKNLEQDWNSVWFHVDSLILNQELHLEHKPTHLLNAEQYSSTHSFVSFMREFDTHNTAYRCVT